MIDQDEAEIRNEIKKKKKNISFIEETLAQDELNTSNETEESVDEAEVYAAKMVKNRQPSTF